MNWPKGTATIVGLTTGVYAIASNLLSGGIDSQHVWLGHTHLILSRIFLPKSIYTSLDIVILIFIFSRYVKKAIMKFKQRKDERRMKWKERWADAKGVMRVVGKSQGALNYLGRCGLLLCGELNTDQYYAQRQSIQHIYSIPPHYIFKFLVFTLILVMVATFNTPALTIESQSETNTSKGAGQDLELDGQVRVVETTEREREISSLESEVLKTLRIINNWKDPSLGEVRRQTEVELSLLLTLLHKLIDEETESFLKGLDRYCSNALRECPNERWLLLFGRRKVFLKNMAHWGQSTGQGLFEEVAKKKTRSASLRDVIEAERTATELSNILGQVEKQLENPDTELLLRHKFSNINMNQREYETIPKPFYGLSEEPIGQHSVAKVTVETPSGLLTSHKRSIHSYSCANAESPPHVWLNQVRHYVKDKANDNPYLAQLFGYNRCGERFDLVFHGSLIPFDEQLQHLTTTQPLEKVELISKTSWKLHSACYYLADQFGLTNPSRNMTQLYWFVINMLHYNKDGGEMVICGDLTQWYHKDIVDRSRDTAKVRHHVMYAVSGVVRTDAKAAPKYPHFSRAGDLYRDLPIEHRCTALLNFYEALGNTCIITPLLYIPFFMRGIHVDPRLHKPCTQHWCRPMVDIWNQVVKDYIALPEPVQDDVPQYHPRNDFHTPFPKELITGAPSYLRVLSSHGPHADWSRFGQGKPGSTPLELHEASLIWLSQAGRIFSSSQFQKSGLRRRDIMYITTDCLHSTFMLDPPSPETIPVGLSLELTSWMPHMDMNGIDIGPTKWTTADPQHRSQLCEASWTMQKYFYCSADAYYWDDDAYEALDEFHRSIGMDPSSGEMAELLGFPLIDINDLLHTHGWTCSHPSIEDSLVKHTLTRKDVEVSWDLPIHPPSSMVKDGTSEINIKMKRYYDKDGDGRFCRSDLDYSPPPMYGTLVVHWIIMLVRFVLKYALGN